MTQQIEKDLGIKKEGDEIRLSHDGRYWRLSAVRDRELEVEESYRIETGRFDFIKNKKQLDSSLPDWLEEFLSKNDFEVKR